MDCLDCLSITEVPTLTGAQRCLKPIVGGYKNFYAVYCGVQITPANVDDFLSGTAVPLNAAAIAIAVAHGATAPTQATIVECAGWGLLGTLGDNLRGSLTPQDTITAPSGSCEQPTIANNVWRLTVSQTRVGRAGSTPDRTLIAALLSNPKAYHLIAVECGEGAAGANVLFSGEFVYSGYNFTRPEDGIREFVTRGISMDVTSLLEPESMAFAAYSNLQAVFQ